LRAIAFEMMVAFLENECHTSNISDSKIHLPAAIVIRKDNN